MNDQPRSQIDHEAMELLRAYEMLSRYPDYQIARIINHYASMMSYAVQAKRILEMIQYDDPKNPDAVKALEYMVEAMKRGHATDLGIKLEWPAMPPEWVLRPEPRRKDQ